MKSYQEIIQSSREESLECYKRMLDTERAEAYQSGRVIMNLGFKKLFKRVDELNF